LGWKIERQRHAVRLIWAEHYSYTPFAVRTRETGSLAISLTKLPGAI
jgi:hypothetical protein